MPPDVIRGFERFVILRTIDEKWKDHLYAMDQLREGINLRAYGQKNPLLEYKSEGFGMFQEMMKDMNAFISFIISWNIPKPSDLYSNSGFFCPYALRFIPSRN